jgi:hypothetical protein
MHLKVLNNNIAVNMDTKPKTLHPGGIRTNELHTYIYVCRYAGSFYQYGYLCQKGQARNTSCLHLVSSINNVFLHKFELEMA